MTTEAEAEPGGNIFDDAIKRLDRAFEFAEIDREAIETAMSGFSPQTVRLARIKNTGDLHELDVSEPLLGEVHRNPRLLKLGEQGQFAFSSEGHLV